MAATWIKPLHANKGKTLAATLELRTDYAKNPEKTKIGELITGYECDPFTVDAEFLLTKKEYERVTGLKQKSDVIAYHIRQSFSPGEVDEAKANRLGYELALRYTKGKHAFIVATHNDRKHIHNHVIFNSTTLDCKQKFKNFWKSTYAIRKLSDLICLENGLSVIENPKPSKGRNYGKWLSEKKSDGNFLLTIQGKIRMMSASPNSLGKSITNLKQAAKTLIFLEENGISSLDELAEKAGSAAAKTAELRDKIRTIEDRQKTISELQKQIGTYGKTRDLYSAYKSSGWSRKFYDEHAAEIILHRTAKKFFDEQKFAKLPKISELRQEWAILNSEKKSLYGEYHKAKDAARELVIARENTAQIWGTSGDAKSHGTQR